MTLSRLAIRWASRAAIPNFVISNAKFRWIPQQDFVEQICVSSEMLQYLNVIANPAGNATGK